MTITDHDTNRPGIQVLNDLYSVHTSDGSMLVGAASADIATRFAVHTLITAGRPAPDIRGTGLATNDEVSDFEDDIATMLGITSGAPIPPDVMTEAQRLLDPLRLATYRTLTERDAAEATPLPTAAAVAALRVPDEYRLDMARGVYLVRNLVWVVGWAVLAMLPLWAGAVYWLGIVYDWWYPVGWQAGESLLANRDVIVMSVLTPVAGAAFVWGLLWYVVTYRSLYAHFNLWPDRGGTWDRDQ